MPEHNSRPDIYSGVGSVFERIGDFFHIFDLSFLISGSVAFGSLIFLYFRLGLSRELPLPPWVLVVSVVIGSYVCGLLSFICGRALSYQFPWLRKGKLDKILFAALHDHKLVPSMTEPYLQYSNQGGTSRFRLYVRMWSEIAHKSSGIFLNHLMRYWAMAATCDGLGFSFISWLYRALGFPLIEWTCQLHCWGRRPAWAQPIVVFFRDRSTTNIRLRTSLLISQ
jgi:hypothetical protein